MSVVAPMPDRRRVASLLWFPFFFVAAMSVLFSMAFDAPAPRSVAVGVLAQEDQARSLITDLSHPAGAYAVTEVDSRTQARSAVADGALAGVLSCPGTSGDDCDVFIASAASKARSLTVSAALQEVAVGNGRTAQVVDVNPLAPGDASGAGVFFYALPLAMTGMVTSIVLLQLAMWPTVRKILTIVVVGAFASLVAFAISVGRGSLPADPLLLAAGFFLVQAIGWTTTAAAAFVRQFFVPVALTFVLVLGVPTSGGTVAADMLPRGLAALHHVLPLGAFVDVVRASAYGIGSLAVPGAVLIGWTALGAALLLLAHRHRARQHRAAQHRAAVVAAASAVAEPGSTRDHSHTVFGTVKNLSGVPVGEAMVMLLDDSGAEVEQTTTHTDGVYAVHDVSPGLHHLVVTAAHCEPAMITLSVPADRRGSRHDVHVQDWQDPAGNLNASEIG